jgi:Rps23 Pro-64 3,4-dihydroxylase Tpa1-like proline 4-hydroxylase
MVDINKFDINKLRHQFLTANPFNYIVIDNFLDISLVNESELELRKLPDSDWFDKETDFKNINNEPDCDTQSKKVALNIRKQIPTITNSIIDLFASETIIKFIEDITNIQGLQSDPYLLGGGVHKTTTNGHLSIHADFNIHPQTGKHRRVNALLYLNSNWKKEFQGELELWNKDMLSCAKKIEPISNRLVIFRITDDALHGSPEKWLAPPDYARLSLAFYYYTDDRPDEEKAPFHWANWYKRLGLYY